MYEDRKFRFKISVIGDGGVGKTPLLKKFTQGSFKKDYVKTIGAQFSKYEKKIERDEIRLIFWDIAGEDDFIFLRPSFYKESGAAIIIYSLENNIAGKESLNHISKYIDDIRKFCGAIPIFLFGNTENPARSDTCYNSDIQEIALKYNCTSYYKTSIRSELSVIQAFNEIIELLYNKSKKLLKQNSD